MNCTIDCKAKKNAGQENTNHRQKHKPFWQTPKRITSKNSKYLKDCKIKRSLVQCDSFQLQRERMSHDFKESSSVRMSTHTCTNMDSGCLLHNSTQLKIKRQKTSKKLPMILFHHHCLSLCPLKPLPMQQTLNMSYRWLPQERPLTLHFSFSGVLIFCQTCRGSHWQANSLMQWVRGRSASRNPHDDHLEAGVTPSLYPLPKVPSALPSLHKKLAFLPSRCSRS